jgi:hypothetical protein
LYQRLGRSSLNRQGDLFPPNLKYNDKVEFDAVSRPEGAEKHFVAEVRENRLNINAPGAAISRSRYLGTPEIDLMSVLSVIVRSSSRY